MSKPSLSKMLEDEGFDKAQSKSMAERLKEIGDNEKAILEIPLSFGFNGGKIQSIYVTWLKSESEAELEEDSILPPKRTTRRRKSKSSKSSKENS